MAVAFGAAYGGGVVAGTTNPKNLNGFITAGTNLGILVYIANNITVADATVTGITWSLGSGTAYQVATVAVSLLCRLSIWAIPAVTAGTGDCIVTFSGSLTNYNISASYFTGVDQTTPCVIADAVTASGATNPLTGTPANLTANDASSMTGANATIGDAPHVSDTETQFNNGGSVNMSAGYRLGTGAVSCTWGSASTSDTFIAVRVKASGGAAAGFGPPLAFRRNNPIVGGSS